MDNGTSMKSGLLASVVFHVAVIGALIIGLPNLDDELSTGSQASIPIVFENSVLADSTNQVDGTEIAEPEAPDVVPPTPAPAEPVEVTEAEPTPEPPPEEPPPPEVAPPLPEAVEEPAPPPPDEVAQPDPVVEPVPAPPEPVPQVAEAIPEPTPEAAPEPIPEVAPEPAPVEAQVAEVPPAAPLTPPKKPQREVALPEPEKKPAPAKPKDALSSILKDVTKREETAKPEETQTATATETPTVSSKKGGKLTMSEEDALKGQLAGCWNIPAGAKGIEEMTVRIVVTIGQDRRPMTVEVEDKSRAASDPFFRTLADSAVRAVWKCGDQGLAVPPDKYDIWSETIVTFDPSKMF